MDEIDPVPRRPAAVGALDEAALNRIADALAESYGALYQELPVRPRASLTGDMLAFSFEDGLTVADKALLGGGHTARLGQFRRHFFEVVDGELSAVIAKLTGVPVNYSFYGFDPGRRTTHGIFILDLGTAQGVRGGQVVPDWSEQVRRSSGRLPREHDETEAYYGPLKEEWKAKQEELSRREPKGRRRDGSDER